jgi:hypothetical protein
MFLVTRRWWQYLPSKIPGFRKTRRLYIGVLINLWLFLFSYLQRNKKIVLDGLKKLEQRSHKCVELKGEYVE